MKIVGAVSNQSCENWWNDNSIYQYCDAHGMPFQDNQLRNDNETHQFIADNAVNCLIMVQHSWILPRAILEAVGERAFNLHLAPLPKYRGWNGCSHAILNSEREYGVTLHRAATRVDSGDISYEARFPIDVTDTARSLYDRAEQEGLTLFEALIKDLSELRDPIHRPMVGAANYYARHVLDDARQIRCPSNVSELDRKARAFYFPPFEPAFILIGRQKVYVLPEQGWKPAPHVR